MNATTPSTVRSRRTAQGRVRAVDDDLQALRYLRDTLAEAGYQPVIVITGDPQEAVCLMEREPPGLALLDLVLPDTDGIELMGRVREIADVPVILLSVYGQDEVIARSFDEGTADYVVKPFSPMELAEPARPYVRGELSVDYALRRVTLAGNPVALTATECRMLVEISAKAGLLLPTSTCCNGSGGRTRERTPG